MIIEVDEEIILNLLKKQLENFFLVSKDEKIILKDLMDSVLMKCEYCFAHSSNKYYSKDGKTYFNPFHSGQYSIFLYYFSNLVFQGNNKDFQLADKIYYLNKIMNSCDLFYAVSLPDIFMLDHPVGSVMGRAVYGDFFTFGQNCTVGNNKGIFPRIGRNVTMSANSMILGNCNIGDNVTIGAGACIKDHSIPSNSIVFGQSPNLIIKSKVEIHE